MESSFLELRCKEVINVVDGRLLGHIVDMTIDLKTSRVLGLVVPMSKGFFSFFKSQQDLFIPYKNICKIGEDVILVELYNLPQLKKQKTASVLKKEEKIDEEVQPISPKVYTTENIEKVYEDKLEK